jgi:hypothetical protein
MVNFWTGTVVSYNIFINRSYLTIEKIFKSVFEGLKMTEMPRTAISQKDFWITILAVSVGLIVLSYLLASGLNVHLGLVLSILGILSIGTGNLLSLPARRYERRLGIRHINLFKLPSPEEYIAGNLFVARHSTSFYCFENVLLLAGFIDLLIGLVILF